MPCDWPNKPSMLGLGPLRRDCARKAISLIKPWQLQREDDGCSTFLRMVARLDQGSSVLIGSLAHSLSKPAETESRKQNRHRFLKPENDCRHHQLTSCSPVCCSPPGRWEIAWAINRSSWLAYSW